MEVLSLRSRLVQNSFDVPRSRKETSTAKTAEAPSTSAPSAPSEQKVFLGDFLAGLRDDLSLNKDENSLAFYT